MSAQPPKQRVARSVKAAEQRAAKEGKVLKVLFLDEKGEAVGEYASQQLPENPWAGQMGGGLQEPPYRLEQLTYLAEMHPVHASALEQKMLDVCGRGWDWVPRDEGDNPDEKWKADVDEWFEQLSPDDMDMREVLQKVVLDVETNGWGLLEVLRDPQGIVRRLVPVPAHTVRAHRDGFRLAQVRDSRKVWFKRWGSPLSAGGRPYLVDAKTGAISIMTPPKHLANDLFVIKKPSRRSDWYGIPTYVSSIGWITLSLAARDDNLFFFSNRREPRWAIILSNLADDPDLEEDLRRTFQVDFRQPYRNVLIPITGPGKIDFQKLTDNRIDGTFGELDSRAKEAILISHRVPAERLANTQVGALGGNIADQANRIYKESVVGPGQELMNFRFNRFFEIEYSTVSGDEVDPSKRVRLPWKFELQDLDLGTEREELDLAAIEFHANMSTLREARAAAGRDPLKVPAESEPVEAEPQVDPDTGVPAIDPTTGEQIMNQPEDTREVDDEGMVESKYNDMLFSQLPGVSSGQAGAPGAPPPGSGGLTGAPVRAQRDLALERLTEDVRKLWATSRQTADVVERQVQELTERVTKGQ